MHGGDVYRNKVELDFSVNINPCGIPEGVKVALFNAIEGSTRYPDMECERLRKKLSEKFGVEKENILCGNGASELILATINGIKPKKILVPAPGFSGYEKAGEAVEAEVIYYNLKIEKEFWQDFDKLIKAIEKNKPEIVFITNPNNPNGSIIYLEDMVKIAKVCKKENAILVIDECFSELVTLSSEEKISFIEEINNFNNVVILRAFTKSFAIPGVRLGYLINSDEALITKIKNQIPEWNVSGLAEEAGLGALEEKEFLEASRKVIAEERKFLEEELTKLGIKVYSSRANFLLVESKLPLKEKLLEKGILIRDCSDYVGLSKGFYRIAVKTHEENEKLIKVIKGESIEQEKEKIEFVLPSEIEKRSFEIIGEECKKRGIVIPQKEEAVTKRVIHTSADFEYARTLCYSENAIEIARDLIRKGADIVTDTNMAKAGINKATLLKFGGEVHCFMADEDVAKEAKERGVTRATVSMEKASKLDKPVIFAIGNAPTALIALKELMDDTGYQPAFIIGVPVGFVNVVAAKELIIESNVPYIVNRGRKGGSNVAAAICNALLYGMIKRD